MLDMTDPTRPSYDLNEAMASHDGTEARKIGDHSLYLIITEEYGQSRGALEIAELAIAGGVDLIQMREKNKAYRELVGLGKGLAGLCKKHDVTFIVNDDPILAEELNADGVHLGQEDMLSCPSVRAREILGRDKIIGVSTHSPEQFKKANEEDVDYIAYGPIFYTKTKDYFIGTGDISHVMKIAARPVFFIGGIDLSNIDRVLKEGARNIAVLRGIPEADDITRRTREFKERLTALMEGGPAHDHKD